MSISDDPGDGSTHNVVKALAVSGDIDDLVSGILIRLLVELGDVAINQLACRATMLVQRRSPQKYGRPTR